MSVVVTTFVLFRDPYAHFKALDPKSHVVLPSAGNITIKKPHPGKEFEVSAARNAEGVQEVRK